MKFCLNRNAVSHRSNVSVRQTERLQSKNQFGNYRSLNRNASILRLKIWCRQFSHAHTSWCCIRLELGEQKICTDKLFEIWEKSAITHIRKRIRHLILANLPVIFLGRQWKLFVEWGLQRQNSLFARRSCIYQIPDFLNTINCRPSELGLDFLPCTPVRQTSSDVLEKSSDWEEKYLGKIFQIFFCRPRTFKCCFSK